MKVVGWGLRCLDGPVMLEHMSKERQAGKLSWMIVGFWKHVSNPIPLDLVSNGFHMKAISKKHVQQMWGSRNFLGTTTFCFMLWFRNSPAYHGYNHA